MNGRKSSRVTLVLLGVAALAGGCGRDDARRDVYKTREDCLADWGNKAEDCTPATQSVHAGSGYWYGPIYPYRSWSSGSSWTNSSRTSRAVGSTSTGNSVSRGGFGSSAHSSSGG
jgi:uncharacterized protein YgiB involved in biofilm formation